jgi:hypothetical protein
MAKRRSLTLLEPGIVQKLRGLSIHLARDSVLRSAFLENPSAVVSELFSETKGTGDLQDSWDAGNKLVMAVLSNDDFRRELQSTFSRNSDMSDRETVVSQFGSLVQKHGDPEISWNFSEISEKTAMPSAILGAVFVVVIIAVVAFGFQTSGTKSITARDVLALGRQLVAHSKAMRKAGGLVK